MTKLPLHRERHNVLYALIWTSLLSIIFALTPLFAQKENQDGIVHDRVMPKLVSDPRLKTDALEVDVVEGLVTIKGLVKTEKLRARVDKVVNQVRVHR